MGFPTPFNNEIAAQLKQSRMDKQFAQTPTGASIKAYKNQHKRTGSSLLRDAKANTQGLGAAAHREFIQPITNAVDGLRQSGFVKALGFGESPLEQGRRVTNAKHRMQYAAPIASPTQQAAPNFDMLGSSPESIHNMFTALQAPVQQSAQELVPMTGDATVARPKSLMEYYRQGEQNGVPMFSNQGKAPIAQNFAPTTNLQDRLANYAQASQDFQAVNAMRQGLRDSGPNVAKQSKAQAAHIGWGDRKRMQNIMTELSSLGSMFSGKMSDAEKAKAAILGAEYKGLAGQGMDLAMLQNNLDTQGLRNVGGAEVAGIGANAQRDIAGLRGQFGLQEADIRNQGASQQTQMTQQSAMDRLNVEGKQRSGLAALNNEAAMNRTKFSEANANYRADIQAQARARSKKAKIPTSLSNAGIKKGTPFANAALQSPEMANMSGGQVLKVQSYIDALEGDPNRITPDMLSAAARSVASGMSPAQFKEKWLSGSK